MDQLPSISLCMIVKDEEAYLERCLQSVSSFVSEMIIVDTGSNDCTKLICKKFGATIIEYEWNGHFADARNIGIKQASGDWVLWLDADEELQVQPDTLLTLLQQTKATILSINVNNFVGEEASKEKQDTFTLYQYRLFRNHCNLIFENRIHELLRVESAHTIEAVSPEIVQVNHYGYLTSHVEKKKKSERNLYLLQKELEENQSAPWTLFHLANECSALKQYDIAFQYVNKAIVAFIELGKKPPSILYRLKYGILMETNNYEGAWPAINKAIQLYPDYVDLQFYKGLILFMKEEYEESLVAFQKCLDIGEHHSEYPILKGVGSFRANYYMGLCYEKLNKVKDAEQSFLKAEKVDKKLR